MDEPVVNNQPFVPPNAVCATHPDRPSVWACERCGSFMCNQCQVVTPSGTSLCMDCFFRYSRAAPEPVPWEDSNARSRVMAWFRTVVAVWRQPGDTFERIATKSGYMKPALFGMFCCMFIILPTWILVGLWYDMLSLGPSAMVVPALISILAFPASVLIVLVATAALLHLFMIPFKSVRGGFQTTFRVVGYASAVNVVFIFPYCGEILALPAAVAVLSIGLQKIKGLGRWQSIAVAVVLVGVTSAIGAAAILYAVFTMR